MTTAVIGRILRSADFERVLGSPSRARSVHFAVHYLPSMPSRPARPSKAVPLADLSTGTVPDMVQAVDEPAPAGGEAVVSAPAPDGLWLGTVVPKRHAKRAVTRTLLKHQIHRAVADQAGADATGGLPRGLWVVRLRTPFDRKLFTSAASDALRLAAADELSAVMAHAARRAAR